MAGLAQTINKALSGALRGAGAAFETLGRTLEVNPHVDKRKSTSTALLLLLYTTKRLSVYGFAPWGMIG